MPDRKKVIKGLECCLPMTTRYGIGDCKNCPYDREITLEGGLCECCHSLVVDTLALLRAQEPITGETSDGYHTFNELYHHRAVLFSVIVANYPDKAWKSKKHLLLRK